MRTHIRWHDVLLGSLVLAAAGSVPWWPAYVCGERARRPSIKPQKDPLYQTWVARAKPLPEGKARSNVIAVLRRAIAEAKGVGADAAPNCEIHCLIVKLWTETGDFPGAIAATRIIPSDYNRALTLIDVAHAQVDAGDSAGARQTLDQLLLASSAGTRDPCYQTVALLNRSRASSAIPPIAGVCDVADHISRAYARAGDVRMALSLLRVAGESEFAVRGIAEAQALTGHLAGALQTVRVVPAAQRDWCLERLACETAELGRLREAFQIAASIRDPQLRTSALRQFSIVRNGGEIKHTVIYSLIQTYTAVVPDGLLRAARMVQLATERERSGDRRAALELLAHASRLAADDDLRIPQSFFVESPAFPFQSKSQLLSAIAEAQSRLGDADGALATVGVIRANWHDLLGGWGRPKQDPGEIECGWLLMRMAEAEMRTRSSTTVTAWIDRIESPMEKAFALAGVARGLIDQARNASAPLGVGVRVGVRATARSAQRLPRHVGIDFGNLAGGSCWVAKHLRQSAWNRPDAVGLAK
jgi:hypothetical protein